MRVPSDPASLEEPSDYASFFDEGDEVGVAEDSDVGIAEDSNTLFTRGVREIVPWPVEILDLPDPTEPELLATGTSERHRARAPQTSQARDTLV